MSAREALEKFRQEDEARDRARVVAASSDFLAPNWDEYSLTSVMTVRKAVALSGGINVAQAWVIDHPVGYGVALAAIKKARDRMKYLAVECCRPSEAEVSLKFLAECAQELGWELPARFPRAACPALRDSISINPEAQEERQARRYNLCVEAGLDMPKDDYGHLPRGIGKVAEKEGVTRQAFAEDVKAHIRRRNQQAAH